MQYINLIDKLSLEDKAKIENYIDIYGVNKENFIGIEKWLQNWSHSKQKLYKLLGNKFIHKINFRYIKDNYELKHEVCNILFKTPFKESYHSFYCDYIHSLYETEKISEETKEAFNRLTDIDNFINDKIVYGLKIKIPSKKNTLQLQSGMKPVRALQKIAEYFKDEYNFEDFEDFRLKHSMIFNDKSIKANLCFSIHPLDFMTMSDNASNWSSCMSWREEGCYHVGTIEMMNSNNVLCCYLESKTPFIFAANNINPKTGEIIGCWNNKRWRTLAYVNKDIIMSGKPYPYANEELSKIIIAEIRKLAKINMNWKYSFGPELYQDMQYINSNFSMRRARKYINNNDTKKHNILWDTHGMYNDMLNDHRTKYWCYRNKVNKNKIFSVSGKATCLCCGESIISDNYNEEDDYNERFINCGDVVCEECIEEYFSCNSCNEDNKHIKYFNIKLTNGQKRKLCEKCYAKTIKRCPDCGKPIFCDEPFAYFIKDTNKRFICYVNEFTDEEDNVQKIFFCKKCGTNHLSDVNLVRMKGRFGDTIHNYPSMNQNIAEKYVYHNMEDVSNIFEDVELSYTYYF